MPRVAVGERVPTTTDEPRDVAYGLSGLCIPFYMFHQTRGGSEHPLLGSLLPATQPTTHHPIRSPGKLLDSPRLAAGPAAATDSMTIVGWANCAFRAA